MLPWSAAPSCSACSGPRPSRRPAPQQVGPDIVTGRVLVTWAPGASAAERRTVRAQHGLTTERVVPGLGVEALHIPGNAPQQVAAALAHNPAVQIAEPDYVLEVDATNDPGYDELWGLDNRGQTGGLTDVDVDAPEAWAHTTGSSDVIVAVIDTGTDISHPDLAAEHLDQPR